MLHLRLPLHLLLPFVAAPLACVPGSNPEPPIPPGPQGVDPSLPAAQGEALAGQVRAGAGESALMGGLGAEGQAGDFMLWNSLVRFVIQDAREGHGYIGAGGGIIDFDLVRPAGMLSRDGIDDFFLANGIGWLFDPDRVDVIADGSDGGPAVVRASGGWEMWEFINGTIESDEPLVPWTDVAISIDYELSPESYSLKITASITSRAAEPTLVNPTWGYLASDEDWYPWASGQGNSVSSYDDVMAMGGAGMQGEAAFSLWADEGPLRTLGLAELASSAGILVTSLGWTEVAPGDTLTFVRYVTVAPDSLRAEAERIATQGGELGRVGGAVTGPGGVGVPGVRLHFVESGAADPWVAGYATTGPDGTWEADVQPGDWDVYAVGLAPDQHVDLPRGAGRVGPFAAAGANEAALAALAETASALPLEHAAGWPVPEPLQITVAAGAPAELDVQLEPGGTLVLDVADDDGHALPAWLEVWWEDGSGPPDTVPAELKAALGVPDSTTRFARAWTPDGHVELPILPGSYRLEVEGSYRHGRLELGGVVVAPGETAQVEATLPEIVPHDGWLSMDSHLHAAPSNDGHLPMEHRVVACAVSGIDLPVNTDHDRMADYRPITEALGLQDDLQFIPGVEVSPALRGHFNIFPLDPRPLELVNGGAPPWWSFPAEYGDAYTEEILFERIRAAGLADSVLEANHPRSGLFSFAGYDPTTGQPGEADLWSWGFDLFELVNGSGREHIDEIRQDWFSFLAQGIVKTPVGVSDSHSRTSPCGYGRTDVFLDTDDPASVTPAQLRGALLAGHVVVSGGITLRVASGDALPGDTLTGPDHEIGVRILGPDWMRPTWVRLWRNGAEVQTAALPDAAQDGVWWDDAFDVSDEDDAWYVVEVEGAQALGGLWGGGVPWAAANAIFVDVDGDGWESPGL